MKTQTKTEQPQYERMFICKERKNNKFLAVADSWWDNYTEQQKDLFLELYISLESPNITKIRGFIKSLGAFELRNITIVEFGVIRSKPYTGYTGRYNHSKRIIEFDEV
ncbi:MAG: hypothetical protein AN483_19350 [Aphanizomenon flos-aquae MDT14a]|jgi:hypothetical protein|nr:MAG: hypothetical protein AN483_19350 [Aphanizomenon flos-aquae MDT14a]